MRVTIIAAGSRGDVQPYVALGRGLRAAGHDVTVATHETFREFVTAHGLGFATLAGDPRAMVAAADRWIASGRNRDILPVVGDLFRRGRFGRNDCNLISVPSLGDKTRPNFPRYRRD